MTPDPITKRKVQPMNDKHNQYALQVNLADGWTFVRGSATYTGPDELLWENSLLDAARHIKNWMEYDGRIVRRQVSFWRVVE